jgi:pimeloyl-ACP methyl ester carboxylesterase
MALLAVAAGATWALVRGGATRAAGPPATWVDDAERAVARPMWREGRVIGEWLALHADPVFRGRGVPPGDGSSVVVVPGFGLSDWYLVELRRWLGRLGYRPVPSRIGRAVDCLDLLGNRLDTTVEHVWRQTGRRVHVVGHSLGGVLARSVTARRPERIASVVTLGSPFRGLHAHPLVLRAWRLARWRVRGARGEAIRAACFSLACPCPGVQALRASLPADVIQRALYSRTDGVVDWRYCVTGVPDVDVHVDASHAGMVVSRHAYRAIAEALGTRPAN